MEGKHMLGLTRRNVLSAVATGTLLLSAAACSHTTHHRVGGGGDGASAKATATATGAGGSGGNSGDSGSSGSGGTIVTGPGPTSSYTVAAQPPAGSCHYRSDGGQPLPDPSCTPGAINPKVTQADIASTICRSGYTSDIRPPANITDREKRANAASYGYTATLHDAEYDHLISLELGGDPNDSRNLWVEPPSPGHRSGSGPNNPKDQVENVLHAAVCSGKATLAAAQQAIATDWTTAEARLGLATKR
jgi:hypothetical protein